MRVPSSVKAEIHVSCADIANGITTRLMRAAAPVRLPALPRRLPREEPESIGVLLAPQRNGHAPRVSGALPLRGHIELRVGLCQLFDDGVEGHARAGHARVARRRAPRLARERRVDRERRRSVDRAALRHGRARWWAVVVRRRRERVWRREREERGRRPCRRVVEEGRRGVRAEREWRQRGVPRGRAERVVEAELWRALRVERWRWLERARRRRGEWHLGLEGEVRRAVVLDGAGECVVDWARARGLHARRGLERGGQDGHLGYDWLRVLEGAQCALRAVRPRQAGCMADDWDAERRMSGSKGKSIDGTYKDGLPRDVGRCNP